MTEFLTFCAMVVFINLAVAAIKGEFWEYLRGCLITIGIILAIIVIVMWRAIA